jgi:hypothetical protein
VQGLARIRDWLLSIKHEQEISNHFDQRLAEKEFGGKADEAESENKEEQEKDERADFRLHVGSTSNRIRDDFINMGRESARRDKSAAKTWLR